MRCLPHAFGDDEPVVQHISYTEMLSVYFIFLAAMCDKRYTVIKNCAQNKLYIFKTAFIVSLVWQAYDTAHLMVNGFHSLQTSATEKQTRCQN